MNFPTLLEHAIEQAGSARKLDKILGYHSDGRMTRYAKSGKISREYRQRLYRVYGLSEIERRDRAAKRIMREWRERSTQDGRKI